MAGVIDARVGRVGRRDAGLVRAERGEAAADEAGALLLLALDRVRVLVLAALRDGQVDLEDVAVLVVDVDGHHLVEDVGEERLEAGVALAARRALVLLDRALAVVEVAQHDLEVVGELRRVLRRLRELGDDRLGRLDRGPRGVGGLGERADVALARLGERPELVEEALELAGRRVEVAQVRRRGVGGGAELGHRRPQLAQEGGQALEAGGELAAALGGRGGDVLGLLDEAADVLAVVGEVADDRVRVDGQSLSTWFWRARMSSTLSVSRSAGLARRIVALMSSRAAAGAGAELVEDDPQPLAVGAAHDVGQQVGRDRRGRALDGDGVARLELLGRLAGRAVDVVLADQRLRPRLAGGVGAQRAEAVLGELEVDERLVALVVQPQLRDRPRPHAGDLDVAALDEPERVVELDGELRAALLLGAGRRERVGARAGEDEDDRRARASFARQHLGLVAGEVGARLVGAGAVRGPVLGAARAAVVLPPLQRRRERLVAQLRRDQLVLARAGRAGQRERVRVDADARGGAQRVIGAGVAEVVEPAEQVRRVGAEERELGRGALERLAGRP